MIENALVWVGENPGAALSMLVAALAIGFIIYAAHDIPPYPEKDDDEYGC